MAREDAELLVAARSAEKAQVLAEELGATAVELDVSDLESCRACARVVSALRRGRPLTVVHNAGVAYDLPWFPAPWPQQAAKDTLDPWPWWAGSLRRLAFRLGLWAIFV